MWKKFNDKEQPQIEIAKMDSRLIFAKSEHLKPQIVWTIAGESEWLYFGAEEDVNSEIVKEKITNYFQDSKLYVSYSRSESFETSMDKLIPSLEKLLGFQNFIIWDISFNKAIEFHKIGVLRCGKVAI